MTNDTHYTRLIEDYLYGTINTFDKIELEKRMAIDPALKSEFDLQKDILKVIRDSRKTELKTRLAHTHVGWYYMIPPAWKVAVIITIFTVTGFSAFYYFSHIADKNINPVEIKNFKPEIKIEQPSSTQATPAKTDNNHKNPVADKKASSEKILDKKTVEKPLTETQENETPRVSIPQPVMTDTGSDITDNSLKTDAITKIDGFIPINKNSAKIATVKTVKSRKYSFHYTFTEGALMLYGDFSANPYEILEINSSKGKEYFLFYNSHYFNLKQNTTTVSPLVKVSDNNLLNELDILRNNK